MDKPTVLSRVPEPVRELYFAQRDKRRVPAGDDVAGKMGTYIDEHPTNFIWRADVEEVVKKVQRKWPWKTYINTYWWHPPYDYPSITRRYDTLSFDVWGGGVVDGTYMGYRGKTLPDALHEDIFYYIFNMPGAPYINWILSNGWMWQGGKWSRYDPYDPYNADMGHRRHIHVTYH